MLILTALLLLSFLTSAVADDAPVYLQQNWTMEDGLPQSSVLDLIHDEDGYLWVATLGTLSRFDGHRFHAVADEPTSNRVTALELGADGTLWVGLETGGVHRYVDGVFAGEEFEGRTRVWDVHLTASGELFVASEEGLDVRGPEGWIHLLDGICSSIAEQDGTVYVAGETRGWRRDPDGQWHAETFEIEGVRTVWVDPDGDPWWVGLEAVELHSGDDRVSMELPRAWVGVSPVLLPSGHLLISSEHAIHDLGDWRAAKQTLRSGDSPAAHVIFESEEVIAKLRLDRLGQIWVGIYRMGLWRLTPSPRTAMANRGVFSVVGDGEEGFWFTEQSARRVSHWVPGGQPRVVLPYVAEETDRYTSLAVLDGELYLGTTNHLVRREGASTTTVADLPQDQRTYSLLVDGDDLLIGTETHALYRYRPDGTLETMPAGPLDHVYDALRLPDGRLVVSHRGGIHALEGERWVALGDAPLAAVRDLVPDGEGGLWAATYGSGVVHITNAGETQLVGTGPQGLRDSHLSALVLEDDVLWCFGNLGLTRLRLDDLEDFRTGRSDTLLQRRMAIGEANGPYPPALAVQGGTWFLSLVDRALMIDREELDGPEEPDVLRIEEISHHGRLDGATLTLAPDADRSLSIEVSRPALWRHRVPMFQTRMTSDGEVGAWSFPSTSPHYLFQSLGPGRHHLDIRAVDLDGSEGGELDLDIVVEPRLFERRLPWLLLVALLVGMVAALMQWRWQRAQQRTRELEEAHRKLEASVAERLELQRQVDAARRVQAVSRMAGGIAHDVNNLLTTVLANAELARSAPAAEVETSLDEIEQAATHGRALMLELLTLGRKNPDMDAAPLEVDKVVDKLIPLLRHAMPSDLRLEVHTESSTPVRISRANLEQVLTNLFLNAVQASSSGGVVRIRTSNTDEGVRIEVVDQGHGMTPEVLSQVFDPFFTTRAEGEGTGLGLASVHAIVEAANGIITAGSEPGVGSRFVVDLPRADGPPDASVTARRPAHAEGANLWVCDDQPEVGRATTRLMTRAGHQVRYFSSAAELLHALDAAEQAPDLLITDVVMPSLSGPELVAEVHRRRPGVRVLFISGFAPQHLFERGLDSLDSTSFLAKPFSGAELRDRVAKLLAT